MRHTKGELELFYQDGKLYLECDAPSGKVRLAEMAMSHRGDSVEDAEEIRRRWNAFEDLLEALRRAYFLLQKHHIKDEYFEGLRLKLGDLLPSQIVEIKQIMAAIAKASGK